MINELKNTFQKFNKKISKKNEITDIRLDNFNELFANRKALPTTFNDIQNRLEAKILSKRVSKFYQSHKNSKIKQLI